jgi:predicted transcriptional regulator
MLDLPQGTVTVLFDDPSQVCSLVLHCNTGKGGPGLVTDIASTTTLFSVRLSADQLAAVTELARLTKRSRNAVIGRAIERYVTEELAFIEDCRQATDEALDPQGVRIPHEAVRNWLQTWGTADEEAATAALESLEGSLSAGARGNAAQDPKATR